MKALHPLLNALRAAIGSDLKAAAMAVYPRSTPETARSNLSRVLDGTKNIPPELLDYALDSPGRQALLDYFEARARQDPAQLRSEANDLLRTVAKQLELAFDRLDQADEAEGRERRPPIRVETVRDRAGRVA